MNRDQQYSHWDLMTRYEKFIKETCGVQRYRLLWEVREFLQTFFQIEIDDTTLGSTIVRDFRVKNYEVYNINNLFDEVKHPYFKGNEEEMILNEIFYLIVFAELNRINIGTFRYTLKHGLSLIIKDRSQNAEDKNGYISFYEQFIDYIIDEFSNSFVQLEA